MFLILLRVSSQLLTISDACKVETTTNTPLVIGPNDQVNHIYKMLDVRSIPGVIIKTVDCNHVSEFPILSFRVNDVPIMIAPLDYVIKVSLLLFI